MKEHPRFKGYFFTESGEVFSNLRRKKGCGNQYIPDYSSSPRPLKLSKDTVGYPSVSVRGKTRLVHRLVAETFIENPSNLPEVNHIDKDKTNNRIENLEWVDRFYQMEHACAKHHIIKNVYTGEVVKVFNLMKYCYENGLNHKALYNTKTGTSKQHKGWKIEPSETLQNDL